MIGYLKAMNIIYVKGNNTEDGTDDHGPLDDHNRHFAFLRAEKNITDFAEKSAVLAGPTYQNSIASCTLQFWFYLSGNIGKSNTNFM